MPGTLLAVAVLPLPDQFQTELDPARARGRRDLSKSRGAQKIIGQIKIAMIQRIEKLGAELHVYVFVELGILDYRKAHILVSRPVQDVPP
jgi:hypothetical protein